MNKDKITLKMFIFIIIVTILATIINCTTKNEGYIGVNDYFNKVIALKDNDISYIRIVYMEGDVHEAKLITQQKDIKKVLELIQVAIKKINNLDNIDSIDYTLNKEDILFLIYIGEKEYYSRGPIAIYLDKLTFKGVSYKIDRKTISDLVNLYNHLNYKEEAIRKGWVFCYTVNYINLKKSK